MHGASIAVTLPEPGIVALGYYRDICVQMDSQWRSKQKLIARWDSETAPMVGKTP
jgi:hypothetical protein